MRASDFLKLVGEMRKEQKLFFATRKEYAAEKQAHLVASKALEKRVDQVVAEGYLEPDDLPTATLDVMDGQPADGVQIGFFDEPDAGDL
jgi:hypothetical protein